ncbi:calcium-binding protein [Azovibrio restrictus]|uniref:calcium-binding protein n=1 Tax=Azovibrio restrictus TaxID=146938 RepID=UPI0026ED7418|nr:calcium-binding protein [Azovibrio restrictus]MDD3483404.1 calcium-binding protein [Azovibrio restrictus]
MATYNSSFSDSSEMVADAKQYASGSIAKLVTYGLLDRDEYLEKIKTVLYKWSEGTHYSTSVDDGIRYLPPGAGASDIGWLYFILKAGDGSEEESAPLMSAEEYARRLKIVGDLEKVKKLIEIVESVNDFDFVRIDFSDYYKGDPVGLWENQAFRYNPETGGPDGNPGELISLIYYCSVSNYQVGLLEASYNELVDALYYGLALETRLKPYMDTIVMTPEGADLSGLKQMLADRWAEDHLAAYGDLADLVHSGGNVLRDLGWEPLDLLREWSAYAKNDPELSALMANLNVVEGAIGSSGRDILLGQDAAEWMSGKEGHDIIDGGKGHDTIYGDLGDDTLLGGEGNDTLYGGGGSDVLIGGVGNDYLQGQGGNDIYRFSRGDGQDSVSDYDTSAGNKDVIELGAGISTSDVRITRSGDYMILNIVGSTDKVTVSNYFYNDGDSAYLIEEIRFADGTVWDLNKVKELAIQSTDGNDTLYGYATADTISGGAGNDSIYGKAGDDLLRGDGGRDYLYGEAGNDTLEGGADDDTLYGGEGSDVLRGEEGNDVLYGGGGSDVLIGGVGNDYLHGQEGNDIYRFSRGDGQDSVSDYDTSAGNKDVIELGAGISTSDVRITRSGDYMILNIVGSTDKVTVSNYFYNDGDSAYLIEEIRFADGTVWDLNKVKELAIQSTDGNDTLYGYATADTISGGAGNDSIYGKAGDDLLRGDGGRDYLYGEAGNDTLEGGADDDTLYGGEGSDVLRGEEGNDVLYGGGGSDVLIGGVGNDYLHGQEGNDIYRFSRGDGQDSVSDYDTSAGNKDVIELGAGIGTSDVRITRSGDYMILNILGSTDKVTVSNYFYNDGDSAYLVEEIRFADGTVWDLNKVKELAIQSTAGNDTLYGYATGDTISGGEGNDYIYGMNGDDLLRGDGGRDSLHGGVGNDTLEGGADNDTLYGGEGDDILIGGIGNDNLQGEGGNDIYRFSRGDGQDSVYDYDTTAGNKDVIELGAGISTSDVRITRSGDYMILNIVGSTDKVTVSNYFYNDGDSAYLIEEIRFADGSVWDLKTIKSMAIKSTSGNDSLYGYATADTISGGAGNDYIYGKAGDDLLMGNDGQDYLYGEAGNDTLMGGAGNDYLYGGDGNDLLIGGLGNDSLQGNAGNDTYRLDRGDGQDSVYDYDTIAANVDTLVFGAGISTEQLWFRKVGSNLEVSIIGTEDKMTVSNWYSNTAYRVEQFKTHDGDVLTDGDVQTLVDAMAAFTVPVTGQTVLPDAYQQALAPVIAGCWDLA